MELGTALTDLAAGRARLERPAAPIITTAAGPWCTDFLAITSVVRHGDGLRAYAEGSAQHQEQIGLFTSRDPASPAWRAEPANPVVRVGPAGAGGYDAGGVFDPAVVAFGGGWTMFFSATEGDAHAYALALADGGLPGRASGESIGVATSPDGVHFAKSERPVLDARCPFAVDAGDGTLRVFFVRDVAGGYRVHQAVSRDGITIDSASEREALLPGPASAWDAHTVTTPKIVRAGDRWWMAYAGDRAGLDDPRGIGLAVSDDLDTWRRATTEPLLWAGSAGRFDSASLQSPIFLEWAGEVLMTYAGSDRTVGAGLHSQVGVAKVVPA